MEARFDLHVHSFFSADAASEPEEIIEAAKARGLAGVAITDHDTCEAHAYLRSVGLANAEGTAVDGFLVIPGVEISTGDGHLLCWGAEVDDRKGAPALEAVEAVHRAGGLAAPAHPWDHWRAGIREEVLDTLPIVAIEVFNAAVTSKQFNDRALAYAERRGLAGTSSSDAHHASVVGACATVLEIYELSVASVLRALRHPVGVESRYLTLSEAFKKHFANLFRKPRRTVVTG